MKKRKQIALNRLFNFCILFGLFLAWVALVSITGDEIAFGIVLGVIALILIVLPAIFTPYCYLFDDEGLSLCYLFLPVERYLWKDIYAIEVEDRLGQRKSLLLFFLCTYVFSIYGEIAGEEKFYMRGHIRKSFRTKYLLEKYWDGTITGYWFENTKKFIQKRKKQRQNHIKAHLSDEISEMEREIRAQARAWLKPFIEKANKDGLKIKTEYIYTTGNFKKCRSRPDEGYSYTLVAKVSRLDEENNDRNVPVSTDLLYVRLGKTAYRGIANKHAREELEFILSDTLNEINQNGIDACLDDN